MNQKKMLVISVSVLSVVVIGLLFLRNCNSRIFEGRALNVIESLQAGDFQKATNDFNSTSKAQMTPEQLGQAWSKTIAMFGPLREHTITYAGPETDARYICGVYITCKFEKGNLYGVVKFDSAKQIDMFALFGKPQR